MRLFPFRESGALPAISAASSTECVVDFLPRHGLVHEADLLRALGGDVATGEEQLARARGPHRVEELLDARVAVDQPELARRHAELEAGRGHAQVTA